VSTTTTAQLALLIVGLVTWGYGSRVDEASLRMLGIVLFAVATALRFFRPSRGGPRPDRADDDETDSSDGPGRGTPV
jgi:hypothetical protein